ncbi:MAG: hypothetical protein RLZZ289_83, partial [Bacteroidota bacterium]
IYILNCFYSRGILRKNREGYCTNNEKQIGYNFAHFVEFDAAK